MIGTTLWALTLITEIEIGDFRHDFKQVAVLYTTQIFCEEAMNVYQASSPKGTRLACEPLELRR